MKTYKLMDGGLCYVKDISSWKDAQAIKHKAIWKNAQALSKAKAEVISLEKYRTNLVAMIIERDSKCKPEQK